MLTPAFRRRLFLHQDGFILAMILDALREHRVMDLFAERRVRSVAEITRRTAATSAHLHVALRCLAQQGWLSRDGTPGSDALAYRLTDAGRTVTPVLPLYADLGRFLRRYLPLEKSLLNGSGPAPRREFAHWVDRALNDWSLTQDFPQLGAQHDQIRHHLNGNLALSIMLALWHLNYFESPLPAGERDESISHALRFLEYLGWYNRARDTWTIEGKIICGHALHYGMVGSYYPMLTELNSLLFGNRAIHAGNNGEEEWHVDRRLNVLASSDAHKRYFLDADDIFLDIFNREPIAEQPAFVADNGCGDGSWLKHIYELVSERTKRGKHLAQYPLLIVAADYNAVALDVARETLAALPSLALFGDITEPDRFARDLAAHGLDIDRGLHIRAFIDHNRLYQPGVQSSNGDLHDLSTGAYVDASGETIPNRVLEHELISFLTRWTPYVGRHGLVLLEAHCVDPRVAARHVGQVHNIVFDTYHGFSQQYPVDFEVFMQAARAAGLDPALHHQRRYPSRKPFVSISINHFSAPKREDAIPKGPEPIDRGHWRPDGRENLADGEALHRLLYQDGDLHTPRAWCANPTALLLREALAQIDARLARLRDGRHPSEVAIADYGAGTGFAVIELLKALRARGTLGQLSELKTKLTIHMLDIPSGWLAKGYELLKDCGYVRFASIRAPDNGAFLPLPSVLDGKRMDIVIASMVLHLIPPVALARLFDGLADVLDEDGALLWSAPDIGPPPACAVPFHQPNRALRQRMLEILDHPSLLDRILERLPASEREPYDDLPIRLTEISRRLTRAARATAQTAADRQILPVANDVDAIAQALAGRFDGRIFSRSFEIRPEDSLAAMLVPANQRYLPEIDDLDLRRRVTTLLMTHEILPALCDGPAGTSYGFSLHWTFGRHRPKKTPRT